MNNSLIKSWIKVFRLRTLPLALSSIITGSLLAVADGLFRWPVVIWAVITTVCLQILSNLANDYGDALKGIDNENRIGPIRSIQSGEISHRQMKIAVIIAASSSLILGIALLYFALGDKLITALIFFIIGIAAIVAAVKYTVGNSAYGYRRLGDLFVFLFFGPTGVAGTYYLNTLSFSWDILLPAASIGFFSTAVLNLNNMRDMDNDMNSGKKTLAAAFGYNIARWYHLLLIAAGWLCAFIYLILNYSSPLNLLFVLILPLFVKDLTDIFHTIDKNLLDPFLKKLAFATLLFAVCFGIGFVL